MERSSQLNSCSLSEEPLIKTVALEELCGFDVKAEVFAEFDVGALELMSPNDETIEASNDEKCCFDQDVALDNVEVVIFDEMLTTSGSAQ